MAEATEVAAVSEAEVGMVSAPSVEVMVGMVAAATAEVAEVAAAARVVVAQVSIAEASSTSQHPQAGKASPPHMRVPVVTRSPRRGGCVLCRCDAASSRFVCCFFSFVHGACLIHRCTRGHWPSFPHRRPRWRRYMLLLCANGVASCPLPHRRLRRRQRMRIFLGSQHCWCCGPLPSCGVVMIASQVIFWHLRSGRFVCFPARIDVPRGAGRLQVLYWPREGHRAHALRRPFYVRSQPRRAPADLQNTSTVRYST